MLLWPNTFNNYFFPTCSKTAAQVLEQTGFTVMIPTRPLYCWHPLYDFGMVPTAKYVLRQILDTRRRDIAEGVPLIGLEPGCVAVFRNELVNLFQTTNRRSGNSVQDGPWGNFLTGNSMIFLDPLSTSGRLCMVIVIKAVMGMDREITMLKKMGLESTLLDSGCCGMAGSFGFKQEHYEMSLAIGEQILLPKIRETAKDNFVIADGFSCREQIVQTTNRQVFHLAEIVQMGMRQTQGEAFVFLKGPIQKK